MNKPVRFLLLSAACAGVCVTLLSCSKSPPVAVVLAPPGPADLGPATGLGTPPEGAVVFDLKYLPQTGARTDIPYHAYWGYGGATDEANRDPFLREVRKKVSEVHPVYNAALQGRQWSAIEYHRRQATALYFDLNADGKFSDNERIAATRAQDQGIEFITPDFMNPVRDGGETFCRVLLQVNFYGWNSEPNCMWSPATMLEGAATLNGQPARLLLYSSGPGGEFDNYGSSSYSLLLGEQDNSAPERYIPREQLSSLINSEGQFYHLTIEGRRSNGLPARVLLTKDTSPTGSLAVKLVSSNSLPSALTTLYLRGVDDKTVFFRVGASKDRVSLPEGAYALNSGSTSYGGADARQWEVSFTEGPQAHVKAGAVVEVALGQPTLKIRAIDERKRYSQDATESATFKKGTQIYLEPKITGKSQEVFGRFRQSQPGRPDQTERPPRVTITGPDGKELLSKVMEYG